MPTFQTHVGLTLKMDGTRVTIEGERVKPLYEGDDAVEAQAVYDAVKEHYEQREFAAAKGTTPEEKDALERDVGFIRTAGPTWKAEWAKQKADVDKKLDRNQPK